VAGVGVAIAVLLLFIVVPVAVLVVAAVLVARSSNRPPAVAAIGEVPVRDAPAAYRRALHHARVTTWASWLLLCCALLVVALVAKGVPDGFPPQTLAVSPAAAGLVFLAACACGELTWPQPAGPVRRAALQVRTVATLAPTRLRRLVWVWAGILVATLLVTGLTGGADGTELTLRPAPGVTSTASPYPGWRYGVPLAVVALVIVAACEAVLGLVARRPAVADTAPEDDHRLRRVSTRRLLAAVQLVLAVTAAAVLAVAAGAAWNASHATWGVGTGTTWTETTSVDSGAAALGVVAGVLAVVVLVAGVVVTVVALARAAAEAARPLTPPAAPAGGPLPQGAPS
jgi:hypothetical protein